MTTATKRKAISTSSRSKAEQKVKSEIQSMLQINGNTQTAQGWVPRVVMMAYERRCAGKPDNRDLALCFSVAQEIASRS